MNLRVSSCLRSGYHLKDCGQREWPKRRGGGGGGGHETNLNPELIELDKGKGASVQPLTAGVLPTDEVLVGLQQPPDFRVVVDRVLQGLHGESGRVM